MLESGYNSPLSILLKIQSVQVRQSHRHQTRLTFNYIRVSTLNSTTIVLISYSSLLVFGSPEILYYDNAFGHRTFAQELHQQDSERCPQRDIQPLSPAISSQGATAKYDDRFVAPMPYLLFLANGCASVERPVVSFILLPHRVRRRPSDDETDLIKSEVEFIRWWRNNQGTTVAPYLRFSVKTKKHREIKQELSVDGMRFVLEYLMSEQYLELDSFYWERIQKRIEAGDVFGFPHLHTLAKSQRDENELFYFHQVQGLLRTHTAPALRRSFVKSDELHPSEGASIQLPALWSTLTHLSLHDLEVSLAVWFALTRAVPNLEWAHNDIARLTDCEDYTDAIEPFSLPRLSTFCVAFRDVNEEAPQFVFSVLFTNLHLPAVQTLSLPWFISDGWYNHDTTATLYTVLKCAPEDAIEEVLEVFVRDTLFSEGSWLDLRSPACPIRTVTIVDPASPADDDSESDADLDEDKDDKLDDSQSDGASGGMGKFTTTSIRKLADQAPNVVFQLSSKSASHIAAEMSNQ
jgi:hypothetical protein